MFGQHFLTLSNYFFSVRYSCDFRRAVIILDAVLLALSVISLIGFAAGTAVNNWDLDDDEIIGIVEDNCKFF
jgi:hypothetical protein